jgi:membrane protein YdbS with pleckstrin-like domain
MVVLIVASALAYHFIKKIHNNATLYALIGTVTAITLFWFIADTIGFKVAGYALREKDVLYRSGWIIRKTRMVPLNRIQHVSMQSGPIERKYGLASITLFTAGGNDSDDFSIRGITTQTATELKEWIRSKISDSSSENLIVDGDAQSA